MNHRKLLARWERTAVPEPSEDNPDCWCCKETISVHDECEFVEGVDMCDACAAKLAAEAQTAIPQLIKELDAAKIEAVDIIETMGELAWGIDLPDLIVTRADGLPQKVPRDFAKQVVEVVYQKLKNNRRFLQQEKEERWKVESELANVQSELKELKSAKPNV